MGHKIKYSLLLIVILCLQIVAQVSKPFNFNQVIEKDSLLFKQISTDSLLESKQIISILAFQKNPGSRYKLEFSYDSKILMPTSKFAELRNAVAAINGGFFDMKKGGSVSYFELNDSIINYTHDSESRLAKQNSIFNGVIIFTKENEILIQPFRDEQYYEMSKDESAVLLTGPLLLIDSAKVKLPVGDFPKRRNPRTFFCLTDSYVILVTVDGRSEKAYGMDLFEAQEYLLSIGIKYAINLDGGGSTTMWLKDRGVVNNPSDKSGERPVSNVLLILDKKNN
jgi:exopolysaccharide biosynthesis protein